MRVTNKNIDISIVIVNYNVKDFLNKCLLSIEKAKSDLSVETIVVDNNSSDNSIEYLTPKFPDVNFIQTGENLGFGRANNIGFENSNGKYILILNPDTLIEENNLKTMYNYMEQHPDTGMAGCKILNPDGSFQLPCRRGFPTPWASFCKLFGLQSLFPQSKLFAQYNQTFRSVDETYSIDAIMGAYMFARTDLLIELSGFDKEFFMYGEDIDLCYRTYQKGHKIDYVHTTTIIHFKGESTKRSSINDVKHFYEAMSIFTKKHYSNSSFFLIFLRLGIFLRSLLAYLIKFKEDFLYLIADLSILNISLLIGTQYKFGNLLGFPEHAYPIVFIVISIAMIISMIFSGEYLEKKHSITKTSYAVLINFFIISSLTYFFKEYAFSRGVILFMTGVSLISMSLLRILIFSYKKTFGSEKDKQVLIVGLTEQAQNLIKSIQTPENQNINLIGFISVEDSYPVNFENIPVKGNINFLNKIISKYKINEVIIADPTLKKGKLMKIISETQNTKARYHIANEYDDLLTSEIIEEITGGKITIPEYPIATIRNRIIKRTFDISSALLLLTILLPYTIFSSNSDMNISNIFKVLFGKLSIVGYFKQEEREYIFGKEGIINIVKINKPERLSPQTIDNLNEYYLSHYNLLLDLEIIVKSIFSR